MKDLIAALKLGTTRPIAFALGLMSIMQALNFWTQTDSWLSHASFIALLQVFDLNTWAGLYAISGIVIIWRVMDDTSKPKVAWCVNILTSLIWLMPVFLKIVFISWHSVLSTSTVIALLAIWVLYRTEATVRDSKVA